MSTVAEIQKAILRLSRKEREELDALVWPEWDRPQGDTPPNIQQKLVEAERGSFKQGNQADMARLLDEIS